MEIRQNQHLEVGLKGLEHRCPKLRGLRHITNGANTSTGANLKIAQPQSVDVTKTEKA